MTLLDTSLIRLWIHESGYTRYTPNAGLMELREALAEKLRRENRVEADPATEIVVTAGGTGASSLVCMHGNY